MKSLSTVFGAWLETKKWQLSSPSSSSGAFLVIVSLILKKILKYLDKFPLVQMEKLPNIA